MRCVADGTWWQCATAAAMIVNMVPSFVGALSERLAQHRDARVPRCWGHAQMNSTSMRLQAPLRAYCPRVHRARAKSLRSSVTL